LFPARKPFSRSIASAAWLLFAFLLLALPAGSASEKQLAIYAENTSYTLPITDHDGREYIGLLDLLEPLGSVSAKTDGQRWKLRFKDLDAEFTQGRDRARVHGREVTLFHPFLLENGRGLIPLAAVSSLLPRLTGSSVTFNEPARRLFVGNVATRFTTELSPGTPPKLVLNFSAPVNPTIATEPGRVRMTFRREPVVAATPSMKFDDAAIPSASFSEANGIAELDVNATVPVIASFSNEGRTITIAPVPQQAAAPNPAAAATPLPPGIVPPPILLPGAPAAPTGPRHFVAVIDASHGGDDHGVALTPTLLEKDVTLALSRRLRQELEARGISALVLRDSDANLTAEQRAIFANTAHPLLYIAVHAASDGHGVRLYTSLLPAGGNNSGPFTAWDAAQFSFLVTSETAAQGVAAELRRKQIPTRILTAPLRPLNNVATAAIALEVAPIGTNVGDLNSPPFQQSLAAILADGIVSVRDKLGAPR
jgi:N-acetylmuramoyl-L-alanine amidase